MVDMSGKESPRPTPAPHIIAPIKRVSNSISKNLFFILNIPENVSLEFLFLVSAIPKATAGKQYIAHAVNDQWKIGYALEYKAFHRSEYFDYLRYCSIQSIQLEPNIVKTHQSLQQTTSIPMKKMNEYLYLVI